MPRLPSGSGGRASASALLRTTGVVVGALLAAASAWIIVTGDTTKRVQIGVLVGLWGLLIVAFAAFGSRKHEPAPDAVSNDLMLRAAGGLDRMQDAEAMRAYEQSLRALLRREIQEAFQAELASLRNEVAALRSEVVEKVGGQLRLERIETTRVIGSDIEALQHEVRQLGMRQPSAVDAEVVDVTRGIVREPVRPPAPAPAPPAAAPAPAAPAPAAAPEPVPQPVVAAAPVAPTAAPVQVPAPPLGAATVNDDPFASLPRIRPFTEFELEPANAGLSIFDQPEIPVTPGSGRHASDAAADAHEGGGRRRRESDDGNDVLSQILQREGRRLQS